MATIVCKCTVHSTALYHFVGVTSNSRVQYTSILYMYEYICKYTSRIREEGVNEYSLFVSTMAFGIRSNLNAFLSEWRRRFECGSTWRTRRCEMDRNSRSQCLLKLSNASSIHLKASRMRLASQLFTIYT